MKDKHEKKLQEGNFLKVSKERLLKVDREKNTNTSKGKREENLQTSCQKQCKPEDKDVKPHL